jgi:protein SCO1/2
VQGVFVTVDPERDTPELLEGLRRQLRPDFVGLRGTPTRRKAVAKEFKVFYAKVPGKTEAATPWTTPPAAYIFDPQGRVRLFTRYGRAPRRCARPARCCSRQ